MANTENRLSALPKDTESLELNSLKDANNMTLNEILDTINGVLSSRPSLTEVQTAEVYLANLKILSERYQSGIKNTIQGDNLDDEYHLYVGTKKRVQLLKNEMRQNMNNGSGTYDPSSDTDSSARSFKNKKRGGSPLDTMMKGDDAQELTSGTIGQQSAFYDNARGYGSIEGKFSDSVGFSAEGILAHMIGENTAIAVDVEAGSKQARFLTTLGYEISKTQRVKLTYEHFRRLTDFMFSSGEVSETIAQNSVGATYRLKLDKETLKYLELNGYMSKTSSKELEDKTFYIDTPTLYELYNNKRRIAGGKKQGGSVTLGLEPWKGGELRLTANYESTAFDTRYENGRDVKKLGGGVRLTQKINDKTSLEVGVGTSSTESLVTEAKLRYALPENVSLYISGQNIRRRGDIGGSDSNENIIAAGVDGPIPSWVPIFGEDTEKLKESAKIYAESQANRKPRPYMPALDMDRNTDALPPLSPTQSKQYNEFLHWVATQPAVKSYTVIALRDQRNDRIVVIDKTILPAAAHPDLMTGDLIVDIVPANDIAGVTRNGAPYINANNFALNSSKNQLIINTASLAVPPAGTTHTYAVTINEQGGGQTVITIDVQHGSVRISRVDIQRIGGAPDTTPDAFTLTDQNNVAVNTLTTSAPITVQGLTAPSPITVAGGEYSINGGAWTNVPGTVTNGQTIRVRHTSSGANSTATNTTLTIGGVSDVFTSTTEAAPVIDVAPVVAAPTATKTDTTVTVTNHITDADGVQNITYSIYSDAATTALVNSNVNGAAFAGLTASTNYWVKTTAETRNGATGAWTFQTSPTLAVTTDAPANVAPTANNFIYGVNIGNTAKTFDWKVLSAAADVNGDTLTATVQVQGTHGTFAIAGDNITYTPAAGYVGSDVATIRISDGQGHTIDRTVTVNGIDTNLVPTIVGLPNWGGGVASGSTTVGKSVTFGDETAWGAGSTVSISASNGATIANIAPDVTSYGVKTFDLIAPANPAGSGPLTVTITYTVTDANGVQTQTTQTVDVAEAVPVPTLTFSPDNGGVPDRDLVSVTEDATTITFHIQTPSSGGNDPSAEVLVQVTNGGKLEVNGTIYTNGQYFTVSDINTAQGTGPNRSGTIRLLKSDDTEVWSKTFTGTGL